VRAAVSQTLLDAGCDMAKVKLVAEVRNAAHYFVVLVVRHPPF